MPSRIRVAGDIGKITTKLSQLLFFSQLPLALFVTEVFLELTFTTLVIEEGCIRVLFRTRDDRQTRRHRRIGYHVRAFCDRPVWTNCNGRVGYCGPSETMNRRIQDTISRLRRRATVLCFPMASMISATPGPVCQRGKYSTHFEEWFHILSYR